MAALLALGPSAQSGETPAWPSIRQYPGITADQSALAHSALRAFYNGDRPRAKEAFADLEHLEQRHELPPLSQLLRVAVNVIHLQRDDAESAEAEKILRREIQAAADQGMAQCRVGGRKAHPTCQLIQGGIQGFMATLKIPGYAVGALRDGLQALKLLEKALAADGRLKDAYLGSGIFHCTVAGAPLMVRASLSMLGRQANLQQGLSDLRTSAYHGQYTTVASQFYLIQFLSPYDDELHREKTEIFRGLEREFPESPYPTFLRWEEALCFRPDSFFRMETRLEMEKRFSEIMPRDFAGRRYLALVKHQYSILPEANPAFAPDTVELREFSYYPVFLQALVAHRALSGFSTDDSTHKERLRGVKSLRDSALDLMENSGMSPANRGFFGWHVKDALKPHRTKKEVKVPESAVPDTTEY